MQFKPNRKTIRLIRQHILECQAMLESLELDAWSRGDRLGRVIHTNHEGAKEIHGLDTRGLYFIRGGKRKRLPIEEADAHILRHIWHYWPELLFAENVPARPKKKAALPTPPRVVNGFVRGDGKGEIRSVATGHSFRANTTFSPHETEMKLPGGSWYPVHIKWSGRATLNITAYKLWSE